MSEKYGLYNAFVNLGGNDYLKILKVGDTNFLDALTYLTYLKDNNKKEETKKKDSKKDV